MNHNHIRRIQRVLITGIFLVVHGICLANSIPESRFKAGGLLIVSADENANTGQRIVYKSDCGFQQATISAGFGLLGFVIGVGIEKISIGKNAGEDGVSHIGDYLGAGLLGALGGLIVGAVYGSKLDCAKL